MPAFSPNYLASWTGGTWTSKPEVPLQGFTQDTRKLREGQVFVALRTEKRDGHEFLPQAAASGASAALVSRPAHELKLPQLVVADPLTAFQVIAREHRRAFRGPVIGVTGSAGKTSTKNLLAKLLGGDPLVLSTEGNLNNHIGVPLTLTRIESGVHESAVIEAGISGPGEMTLLASMIEPDYALVTLVAPAHTAELGGLEGVAWEKAKLLEHIRPAGLGVFPKQCWDFAPFQDLPQTSIVVAPEGSKVTAPRVLFYTLDFSQTRTAIAIGGRRRFELRRVTRGMAQNAVLAIVLASEIGATDDVIQRALEDWQPAKWRGELRQDHQRTLYLDFYNANPASMADALENFISLAPADEPRLLVIGGMEELGADSVRYHRELGRSLQLRPQDRAFVIGDDASAVREGAIESGASPASIEIVDTLKPVAAFLGGFKGAVFIKGSRRYELENALPPADRATSEGGGGATSMGPSNAYSWTRSPLASPIHWQFPRAARTPNRSTNPFL